MDRGAAVDAVLVTAGRIAFVGLWFVAVLLVYRGLGAGPDGLAQAGLFALAIAVVKVVSGCLSDPIDLAVMRRAPGLLRAGSPLGIDVLRAAFTLRAGAAIAVVALLVAAAPLATLALPGLGQSLGLVLIVAVAVIGDLTMRSVLLVLQACERFRTLLLLEGLVPMIRFSGIFILWATGSMEITGVLAVYAAAPFASVMAGVLLMPRALLRPALVQRHDVIHLLQYLKWMMPAMALAAVNERLDVFLVYSHLGADEAGLYGAMITLALMPDIVTGGLSTILQPRIIAIQQSGTFPELTRRFLLIAIPLCGIAFLAAFGLAEPVIALLLGPHYVPAVPAFQWLLAGTLFWLAITPLPMTLIAVLAPHRIVMATAGQSAIVLLGGMTLLPWTGLVGMAQTVFAMRIVIALFLLYAARGAMGAGGAVSGTEWVSSVRS
jgi:O-antigen/teichoic acid export membrane protein